MAFAQNENSCEMTIDCAGFEKLAGQLLQRLRHPVERALKDSSLSPKDLDAIILIGGATRMPFIKSVISKMFGKLPYSNINPDEAVALGAAIQAALKDRNEALSEIILTDVCPYTLGTAVVRSISNGDYESGYFLPIIERNTTIPTSKVERLYTTYDNQTKIRVEIYQGERRRVDGNIKLGEITINVPPAPAGVECIDVRYTYDINGILEVEVVSIGTGIKKRIVIEKSPGSMSQHEIEERLNALKDIKIHPRDRTENRLLIAKGERLYEELLGEQRSYVAYILQKFESILSHQNEEEIKIAAKEIKTEFEKIEESYY